LLSFSIEIFVAKHWEYECGYASVVAAASSFSCAVFSYLSSTLDLMLLSRNILFGIAFVAFVCITDLSCLFCFFSVETNVVFIFTFVCICSPS